MIPKIVVQPTVVRVVVGDGWAPVTAPQQPPPDLTPVWDAITSLENQVVESERRLNDLTDETPMPWEPADMLSGAVVRHAGKTWVNLADVTAAQEPGTDPVWVDLTLEALAARIAALEAKAQP